MRIPGVIIPILSVLFCISTKLSAQCTIYIQMVKSGIEGCVLPVVVSSGEFLLPCSAPAEFNQLEEGDFAYIDYNDSPGCTNICQFGHSVEITCLSLPVGVDDQESVEEIKVFPTLVQSKIYFEGKDIVKFFLFDDRGALIRKLEQTNDGSLEVDNLVSGIYFIKIITKNRVQVWKIAKL